MKVFENQTNFQSLSSKVIDLIFISLIFFCLFFALLGVRPLFVPDEGRYAEIIREMVVSGNYITPYLNGIKYFEKPNLFYWLGSLAVHLNGLSIWSIRSVNALFALVGCLLTYWIARRCYNRATGLLAAFILGTSSLYFVMAHMISLDLTVSVLIAASLDAFLLAYLESPIAKRQGYLTLSAASAGLAVLTKGLIGIVFPTLIIGLWLIVIYKWQVVKRLWQSTPYLPSCILVFLLITAPWHFLVQWHNPEFFNFYFIEQHFLRYTTLSVGHYQPVWYFIPILIIGFFPWIVFLPQTILSYISSWRMRILNPTEIFFILWVICIFLFFSFSKSKLIPYILPLFPPLAILTARYLLHYSQQRIGINIGYIVLIFFSIIITGLFYWYSHTAILPNARLANIYLSFAGITLIIGSCLATRFALRLRYLLSFSITIMTMSIFLLVTLAAIPFIDTRSIQSLADTLKPLLKTKDEVITYNQYFQDLPFYLERQVSILNWRNELSFGMQYQNTKSWMIENVDFWQRWHSTKRVFVLMSLVEYKRFIIYYPRIHPYIIGKTVANILISNKKDSI
ncbi:MAG: hypothetical protein A3F11_04120 [Gammaproteobacteria bacterium RIFCSPHIGHO2_12_FULL_37_14]|nr:MAG: hypothetical protein A3F11_04120 [Gammaproteobacteria bacterium RIFCSPHIGHO2_12_FULL_37_14]